jgi:hypothetical protein
MIFFAEFSVCHPELVSGSNGFWLSSLGEEKRDAEINSA